MKTLQLGAGEPFISPAWGSNFVVFSSETGLPIPESGTKEYIKRACKYARKFGVYLVPERFMLLGYQSMCLITPDGSVAGAQKCTHWHTGQKAGKRSTTLDVLRTEFGSIFLCVDVDIYHPEIPRVACGMGANYIICSQHIGRGDYNSSLVLGGAWSAAQGNHVYSIAVSNEFNCVCAPRKLTKHDDGFLVPPNLKMPMTAKLDAAELEKLPPHPLLSRKLYAMHRTELARP